MTAEQLAVYETAVAKLAVYETAARYQMYHAVGLVLVGLLSAAGSKSSTKRWAPRLAGCCFLVGIICFCGWLYADALLSAAPGCRCSPLGGLLFMVGWLIFAAAGWLLVPRAE